MNDLIEALELMRSKLTLDIRSPFHCEHDTLTVVGVDPALFTEGELARLDELGFFVTEDCGERFFQSFRFGSA